MVILTTNSGMTLACMAKHTILKDQQQTLIIVPGAGLLVQWYQEICERFRSGRSFTYLLQHEKQVKTQPAWQSSPIVLLTSALFIRPALQVPVLSNFYIITNICLYVIACQRP